jgi:hypothetical protein
MSESLDHLTYTVYVSRKNSAMDYGNGSSNEASAHVQVDMPVGTDPTSSEAQVALRNAFNAAKAQVAVTLGMTTALDLEGTLHYDEPHPVAKAPAPMDHRAVAAAFAPEAQATPNVSADGPPFINPERGSEGEKANVKWGRARFATHPDEFFDNRETKRNPKGPDVKHKKWNKNGGWDNDLVAWIN